MRKPFGVTRNRIPSKGGDGDPLSRVAIQLRVECYDFREGTPDLWLANNKRRR